jgi:hypothetical protein
MIANMNRCPFMCFKSFSNVKSITLSALKMVQHVRGFAVSKGSDVDRACFAVGLVAKEESSRGGKGRC